MGEGNQIVAAGNSPPEFRLAIIDASRGSPKPIPVTGRQPLLSAWPQFLPGEQTVIYTASDRLRDFEEARIEALS